MNRLSNAVAALSKAAGPWMDPHSGRPAQAEAATLCAWEGLPLLVPDAALFAARHLGIGPGLVRFEPLPVDAPDALSPHLAPAARLDLGLAPPDLWGPLALRPDADPAAVCAAWGIELAPDGPALDLGCGAATVARRMALAVAAGEREGPVLAVDRSPAMLQLARSALHDGEAAAWVPSSRRGLRPAQPALPPLPTGAVEWAIGDALHPPVLPESIAWLHLGNVLDMVPDGPAALIEAVATTLMPGGLLTLSTPFDDEAAPMPSGPADPTLELAVALKAAGLHEVAVADPVPWLIREYDRGWRLLLCRCVAARRPLRPPRAGSRR